MALLDWFKGFGKKKTRKLRRNYEGARLSRQTTNWLTSAQNANSILRTDLRKLRDRSRDLARNDPYAKQFFQLAKTNIIGKGITLQVHASGTAKAKDQKLTSKIEQRFYDWGKKKTCTLSGKLSFLEVLQLVTMHVFRDGEALIQMIPDARNEFGFSLKVYDPDWLDENLTQQASNGNRIIMGVEVDNEDRPVAYHLREPFQNYPRRERKTSNYTRIPAAEMLHVFNVTESEDQVRGIPALHASMLRLFMLYAFEEAELEQKRLQACQGSYLIPPMDLDVKEFEGEEPEDGAVGVLEGIGVGFQQVLAPGWSVSDFKPTVDQSTEGMRKSVLRGASVGGGVSYHKLAGDLEAVNFSSARAGELSDRDLWREYQEFMICNVCEPIYKRWVEMAWLNGALQDVRLNDFERIQEPTFRGRGWSWVDPAKDMKAHVEGLAAGVTTLTDIKAEQGIDIEDHFINLKKERDLAAKYGIEPTWAVKKEAQPNTQPEMPDGEEK